jgi:superoxide reductase
MGKMEMYKCNTCKMIVEIAVSDDCTDALSGMTKLEAKTEDATQEKHVPYIEEHPDGYVVKVGKEQAHPMTEAHYIQFIELLIDDDKLYRKYLKPGDEPLACFKVEKGEKVSAREYCNVHGLWKY